jgi:glycosyltransferase involved in cell wall biosynthesis
MKSINIPDITRAIIDTIVAYTKTIKLLLVTRENVLPATDKHLLLLTWAFPPDVTGGVYRPISIVRGAKKRGWRVTVISGYSSEEVSAAGNYLEKYTNALAKIIRLTPPKLRPSYKLFFPRIDGGFLNLLETIDLASLSLKHDRPSLILASGPTFHNFVVARVLSKKFGVPYVLDYRDEWTQCPFELVQIGNVDRYFEEKCIRDAAKIIFTTNSHLQHQKRFFPDLDLEKASVVPNGWEEADSPVEQTDNPLGTAEIRLAFVGFLSEHTLPNEFFRSLEKSIDAFPELVRKIRIAFVGSKSDAAVAELSAFKYQEMIECVDRVPKPVALKIMQDADGLLLINEPRLSRYRPGKLYDYISMRTPILVYGGGGEIEDVVEKLQAGAIVRNNDPGELRNALLKLKGLKEKCQTSNIDAWLAEHTRTVLAEKFLDVLESIQK